MKYSKIAAILASLILCYLTDGLIGFGADLGEQENLENPKSLTRPLKGNKSGGTKLEYLGQSKEQG